MRKDGYMEFVAEQATSLGKLFFLDSGEGNDAYDAQHQWDVEDLSGWLINPEDRDKFVNCRNKGKDLVYDQFSESYVFVKWFRQKNDEIGISFKHY